MVKFYRGLAAKYDQSKHSDGLFFATDVGEIYLNDRVYGSEYIVTNVTVSEDGMSLIISYRDQESISVKLADFAKASSSNAGLMSSEDKSSLDELVNAYRQGLGGIKVVSEGDKILTIEDDSIKADVSLNYDEANKKIRLLGKKDTEGKSYILGEVDTTSFVKDGMLSSAKLIVDPEGQEPGTYLELKWNTDSGKNEPMYVPVSELVNIYLAGEGIDIQNNHIGIKIKSGDPYLEVTSNGLSTKGITNAIQTAVAGVSGVSVKIGQEVTIGNETIASDTTVSSALQKIADNSVTSVTGDSYISVTGNNEKQLVLNVANVGKYMVDNTSALKVDNEGRLSFKWEVVE